MANRSRRTATGRAHPQPRLVFGPDEACPRPARRCMTDEAGLVAAWASGSDCTNSGSAGYAGSTGRERPAELAAPRRRLTFQSGARARSFRAPLAGRMNGSKASVRRMA